MRRYAVIFVFCVFMKAHFICSYSHDFKNYASLNNQDTAVLILAYNRPDYLKACLESIEANPESKTMPFIFVLDGGPNSKQRENVNIIKKSKIINKILLIRERNYGCPINHIDSKRFAFEWCDFSKLIVVEEDVIISPNYIRLNLNLYSWACRNFKNVGCVQAWNKCTLTKMEKLKKLNYVRENPDNWSFMSYCLDKKSWDKIKSVLYKYEEFLLLIPAGDEFEKARSKPGLYWEEKGLIKSWVRDLTLNTNIIYGHGELVSIYTNDLFLRFSRQMFFEPHQDSMMGFAMYINGLVKIQSIVNRCIHIGCNGISMNHKIFHRDGYGDVSLDYFVEDNNIIDFSLHMV